LLEYWNFLQHCHQRSSVLHNYFDSPTKLFSDLYLASAKSFFPCSNTFGYAPRIIENRLKYTGNIYELSACIVIYHSKYLPSNIKAQEFPNTRHVLQHFPFDPSRSASFAFCDSLSFLFLFPSISLLSTVSIIDQFPFDASIPTTEPGTPVTDGKHGCNSCTRSRLASIAR